MNVWSRVILEMMLMMMTTMYSDAIQVHLHIRRAVPGDPQGILNFSHSMFIIFLSSIFNFSHTQGAV